MGLSEDVADHLESYFGDAVRRMDPHDLFGPGRLEGDDAHEYLDSFSARFGVDLTGFRDYLHFDGDEPPIHRRAWGVTPDGARMDYIRVGLSDLVRAAEAGHWNMPYPPHRRIETGLLGLAGRGFVKTVLLAAAVLLVFWVLTPI